MQKKHFYTDERNALILIALLKAHGIKRVIASPGSTHMSFLGSIEQDPWFQIWSAVDERHAAYMALGMAADCNEPIVLTCTGSTASRNYLPALTEAFYRKLPILAVTGSQLNSHRGNLFSQCIDRSTPPKDAVKYAYDCTPVENGREATECEFEINKALLELKRHGGGPVHINLETWYGKEFNTRELPVVHKIERFEVDDELPSLSTDVKIAVYIGNHNTFSKCAEQAFERFLCSHNAVAICDLTSQYYGRRRVSSSLVCSQDISQNPAYADLRPDLIIHIGEMSNDYSLGYFCGRAPVWRVNSDGEARNRFGKLEKVFEMSESYFFDHYASSENRTDDYCRAWVDADSKVRSRIPELPFSNLWIASKIVPRIHDDAVLHVGLSTSLQSWTAMIQQRNFKVFSNVAMCGIDGCVSTLIGASLCRPDALYFGVVGDLTFFYDMNSLGNRHIGKNLRLLLVNNGCGGLFHAPGHLQEQFTDILDEHMAAGGHFGNQSRDLVRHYAMDLGFKYLTASNKEDFTRVLNEFVAADSDKPIVFECFVDVLDDRKAWGIRKSIDNYTPPPPAAGADDSIASDIKKLIPRRIKNAVKELIK